MTVNITTEITEDTEIINRLSVCSVVEKQI